MHNCSVVIPTYNRSALVGRAIASALAAISPGDEIIVVDDGSTDDTAQRMQQYRDPVRYIRLPHAGAGATRNQGIQAARHTLVAFLDSDDEWQADKLTLQMTVMEARPDLVFCFSDFTRNDQDAPISPHALSSWHNDPRSWAERLDQRLSYSAIASLPPGRSDFSVYTGDLYFLEMSANYIPTFTLMVRKDPTRSTVLFPVDLEVYEDWEYFGRLAKLGKGAFLDCDTAVQHGHTAHRLTYANLLTRQLSRIRLLERVWGQDSDFLKIHGETFQKILTDQRIGYAKSLLSRGRVREAMSVLSEVKLRQLTQKIIRRVAGRSLYQGTSE
jgi:glycosyltransferase involved in cell wall biosynthesis